eukprot:TRINITY_DN9098_c0_g1_i1.p1 TRINITY_DN9098_c0_g1~~TRINITY_DN9098_c0_g1_i1.p1  ORF type:complete len:993 (+),score=276.06 TRINITY_DN9098_c0_g1_i1:193-3171(+)
MEIYGELRTSTASWHYTNLTRTIAEEILSRRREDGAFLVRDSETVKGASVLSTYAKGLVHHYRISIRQDGTCQLEGEPSKYNSLSTLVDLCKTQPILTVLLTSPIELGAQFDESDLADLDDEDDEGQYIDTMADNGYQKALVTCLETVIGSNSASPFDRALTKYITEAAAADASAAKRAGMTPGFELMLIEAAGPLLKEIDTFTRRMRRVRDVFQMAGQQAGLPHTDDGFDPEQMMGTTKQATEPLLFLQKKLHAATKMLTDTAAQSATYFQQVDWGESSQDDVPNLEQIQVPENNAEVYHVRKIEKVMGKAERIVVNLTNGTVTTGGLKASPKDDKVYDHGDVLQLIKSRSNKQRLAVLFKGKRRKDYLFDDLATREDFCQKIHLMKLRHEHQTPTEGHLRNVNVWVGTFNMGDVPPPEDLSSWFKCSGQGQTLSNPLECELIAVGSQESVMPEKDWLALIKRHIGPDYNQVAFAKLLQIKLAVFVHKGLQHKISHVEQSVVATGIANKLGNKGGVGISFFVGQTSVCFINCHLAAGAEKMTKRNNNTIDILSKLQLGQKRMAGIDVAAQFHHLFWFGDLNYRINLDLDSVERDALARTNYSRLLQKDQLTLQRAGQRIYFGFEEGEITFAPTYRYKRGTRQAYDSKKQKASGIKINVPSYTDRVLWKSFPGARIKQTSYGCTDDITTSDHSPVFATFEMAIAEQYVSKSPSTPNNCTIAIKTAAGKLRTVASARFILEIYAPFLEGADCIRSLFNSNYDYSQANPLWTADDIPKIKPIIPDRAYLEHEHLLIAVKSQDGEELYGEASLSLMNLFGDEPIQFTLQLSHRGAYTGSLSGSVLITGAVGKGMARTAELFAGEVDEEEEEEVPAYEETSAVFMPQRSSRVFNLERPSPAPPLPSRASKPGDQAPPRPPKPCQRPDNTLKRRAKLGVCEFFQQLSLDHLADTFVEAGYDDLEFFADLEQSDILDLGVSPSQADMIVSAAKQLGDA